MTWQPIETAPVNIPIIVAAECADPDTGAVSLHTWPAMKNLFYKKRKPVWLDLDDGPISDHLGPHVLKFWMHFPEPPK